MKKRTWAYAFLVLVIIAVAHFAAPGVERGEGLRAGATCQKLLTQKKHLEALSWLQQSKPGDIRTLGEQTPEDSLKIVRALYTAGAVDTQVVEIERVAGYGETTNIVCVGLPSGINERKALFKIEAKTASSQGFDPVPDERQTYLFLCKFKLSPWQSLRALFHL